MEGHIATTTTRDARGGDAALLAGRLGLGLIFVLSGLGKLAGWSGTVGYAASHGVPEVLLAGATALELLGGLSLLLGFKARWGAAALLLFLVPVTLVFHAPWTAQGPEVQMQTIQLLKNLAIGGGLVALLGVGAGRLSVDGWRSKASRPAAVGVAEQRRAA